MKVECDMCEEMKEDFYEIVMCGMCYEEWKVWLKTRK